MAASDVSETTLFVGNLPDSITSNKLQEIFSNVGPIKRCFVVSDRETHKSKGVAYVTFVLRENAEEAIKKIKHILNKKINIKFARKRNFAATNNSKEDKNSSKTTDRESKKFKRNKIKGKRNEKSSRLIVRNLSFEATEDDVKKAFQKFGTIEEVVIPLRQDGKKIGCCFVQFSTKDSAHEAIKNMNAKKILDRIVAVDWSVPKNVYEQVQNSVNTKSKETQDDSFKSKDMISNIEFSKGSKTQSAKKSPKRQQKLRERIEDENLSEEDDEEEEETDEKASDYEEEETDSENENEDVDDDDDDEEEDEEGSDYDSDEENSAGFQKKKKQHTSSDINEGKTLFLRNLTFSTTEDHLKEKFGSFGKLAYALLCIDQYTEHPKGTAFIKFEDKESVEKCLQFANDEKEDGGIIINGNKLTVSIALSRDELHKKMEERKTKKETNKRNLHLAREGLIRPGTLAAEGVSASDIAKRQKLENWKKNMLRNLHMFISPVRLCVRNIPITVDDSKLKKIFSSAISKEGKITECRIIRDLKKRDAKGIAMSKSFGFISFMKHEDALQALRQLNNNPTIFTKDQRPIVEFSIENRAALKAKDKRLQKSKQNMSAKASSIAEPVTADTSKEGNEIGPDAPFVGSKSNPKMKLSLPSHSGPKIRHTPRQPTKSTKISRKQFIKNRHKRPKQFKVVESNSKKSKKKSFQSDNVLDKAEKQHRKKIISKSSTTKKKWFD